jgi:hypothetical protein
MGAVLAVLLLAGCRDISGAQPQFVEQGGQPLPNMDPQPQPASSERTPAVVLQVSTRTVTEVLPVPYPTRTVEDDRLEQGARRVLAKGIPGSRTVTYRVTVKGGRQIAKDLLRSTVTKRPVTEVVAVGTRKPPEQEHEDGCNANYSGCVPATADVDCADGGNGPVYQRRPVKVVGIDIYHLDLDGNGEACDGPADIP